MDDPTERSRVVNRVLVPNPGTYQIDPVHTFVTFRAQHVIVGRVRGRFESVTGSAVVADDPAKSSIEVEIQPASVNTLMTLRDDDLRSERFLDVAKYPTMTYRSTSVSEEPNGIWLLGGDLTIRDITRAVELIVRFNGAVQDESSGNLRIGFTATTSITRTEYGLYTDLEKEAGTTNVRGDVLIDIDAELVGLF